MPPSLPPKVEAALLVVLLAGAWIVLENSHRIDLTQPDEEPGQWTTLASCQMPRLSAGSALAAEADAAGGQLNPAAAPCGNADRGDPAAGGTAFQ